MNFCRFEWSLANAISKSRNAFEDKNIQCFFTFGCIRLIKHKRVLFHLWQGIYCFWKLSVCQTKESDWILFFSSRLFRTDTTLPDHAYAVPARVIEMAESLTSLESGSTSLTVSKSGLSGGETGFSSFPVTPSDEDLFHDHQPTSLVHFGQQVCCAPGKKRFASRSKRK